MKKQFFKNYLIIAVLLFAIVPFEPQSMDKIIKGVDMAEIILWFII